ncbi:MAG: MarR family winged helix-turn-helix transcriptional regulator [Nocardioides sp.]
MGAATTPDRARLVVLGSEVLRLARRRASSYPGSQLEESAFRILHRLSEAGPLSLGDLGAELDLEQSTVSRQVSAAVARGLVERTAGAGRGERLVAPTAAGRAAYDHDAGLRAVAWGAAVADFGPDRLETLIGTLSDLNDALDRAHARSSDPS